ncbi:hypothetical protein [Pollutibacter soli]
MPFLLGQPQLLFFEALQDVAAIEIRITAKIINNFRPFMGSKLKILKQ